MRRLILPLLMAFFLMPIYHYAQTQDYETLRNNLDSLRNMHQEKIFVHTDKTLYSPGDTMWYKLYLCDASGHNPSSHSRLVYFEIFDIRENMLHRVKHYVQAEHSYGHFAIPEAMASGVYSMRCYTNHMRNWGDTQFFQGQFKIWDPLTDELSTDSNGANTMVDESGESEQIQKPELRFFPEGGYLVSGLACKVAFEASIGNGAGLSANFDLYDQNDVPVSSFKSYERGLGQFAFTPEQGMQYEVRLSMDGTSFTYPLPPSREKGVVMSLTSRPDQIILKLSHNLESLDALTILGHTRMNVFYELDAKFDADNTFTTIIPTENLEAGVSHFTVFDKNGRALAERLVYIDSAMPQLKIQLSDSLLESQFALNCAFKITDSDVPDDIYNCSVSVYHSASDMVSSEEQSIKTYLLLNSDIRGEIEAPGYFFEKPGDFRRAYLLDILLMCRGWRRFDWSDLQDADYLNNLSYEAEKGIFVEGHVSRIVNSDKSIASRVILTTLDESYYEEEKMTDMEGRFRFGPFVSYDTIDAFLQARRLGSKDQDGLDGNRNVSIHLAEESIPEFSAGDISASPYATVDMLDYQFVEDSRTFAYKEQEYENMMKVQLEEVTVSAKAMTQNDSLNEIKRRYTIYGEPSNRLVMDSKKYVGYQSVFDLLRRIPGVTVIGSPPNQSATIRGVSSINANQDPLYLINGMQVDAGALNSINPSEVLFIDVLKDGRAAIFGFRGANGVISVFLGNNTSGSVERLPGINDFKIKGFYRPLEYYSATRAYEFRQYGLPDKRSTLLWDPKLILSSETPVIRQVFSSDMKGEYRVIVNGLSKNGIPVYAESSFRVE